MFRYLSLQAAAANISTTGVCLASESIQVLSFWNSRFDISFQAATLEFRY